MAAEKLIQSLQKLLKLHQNLHEVTLQKTELIKKDQINELKELLKKEQMYVQAIKQVENERISQTADFLGNEEESTLSLCIEKAEGNEKGQLQHLAAELTDTIKKLKAVNQLNKELTHQAMQFVSISLDMLAPKENVSNYQRPDGQNQQTEKVRRSLFDSQA